jgi:hypothetical protein
MATGTNISMQAARTFEDEPVELTSTYATAQAAPITLPPELASLSSEMLLAYVRTNLNELDRQVTDILHRLNGRREDTAKLSAALTALRSMKQEASSTNTGADVQEENTGFSFNAERQAELRGILGNAGYTDDEIAVMVSDFGTHASGDDVQGVIDSLSDRVGELNNQNEYDTMQITDLLGKRSNLIQMVSKMMASMDESMRAVIQNIG